MFFLNMPIFHHEFPDETPTVAASNLECIREHPQLIRSDSSYNHML